jgi:transposase
VDRYIGLDAHAQSCTFAVMSATGKRLREERIETNGKALQDFVQTIAGRKHVCLEEGTMSEWLYELLEPLATTVAVVMPERSLGNKSDSLDAWARADEMRRGAIRRVVYKAPQRFTALREAVRAYEISQRDMVRGKNRVKALYRSRGISSVGANIYKSEERESWLDQLPPHRRELAELLLAQLDGFIQVHKRAEQWLREEAKRVSIVQRIQTAPGIAEIRAAQIVATVISPHRFRTKKQFLSYCGLGIVTHSSSDWARTAQGKWERRLVAQPRGLNRNRHPILKRVFRGAADAVINNLPEHPLHVAYQRAISAGAKPNLARLTLARRLAASVLAMWKNNEEYDPTRHG